ncbi:hypothetical protein DVH24_014488 [Malus domestica]|uniref:Aminotransferase-like plant mobile domain-containing protein n=1 Tax=Malus domestica TaxID=3750 RepID=A0A498KQ94_MALDO|nr:hypothetical protein DVH24_014488 [Malus domestica]
MKTFPHKTTMKKKKTPDSTEKKRRYRTAYLQYRCNMTRFSDSMETYKPMLEERKDRLIKLYLDHFLVVTKRKKKSNMDLIKKKSNMDLIKVIKCYDPKEQKFRFGDCDARKITLDDVALIFGLNNDGVELPNTDKSSKSSKEDRFIEKYFHNSLLFANSGSYITWSFLQIDARLEEISKYNWAKGVRDYFLKMIDRSQTKKRKGGDKSTTSSCTVLILYWICLKSNLVAMIKDRENMVSAIGR